MLETPIVITIIISSTALLGYFGRLLFASKCSALDMGCIHIKRNTEQERTDISIQNVQSAIV